MRKTLPDVLAVSSTLDFSYFFTRIFKRERYIPSCLTTGLPEVESGGVCGWSRDLGIEDRNSVDAFLGRKVSLLMTAPTPSILDLAGGEPRTS